MLFWQCCVKIQQRSSPSRKTEMTTSEISRTFEPRPPVHPLVRDSTHKVIEKIRGLDEGGYVVPGTESPSYDISMPRVRLRLSDIKDRITKVRRKVRSREDHAFITAVIPAHNEEGSIAKTIESLLLQSRPVDRLVVMVNNSDDRTAAIAREYAREFAPRVIVLDEQNMQHGKVGALGYAWTKYVMGGACDFALFVDADVECHADMLAQLEKELIDQPDAAGIRARYNFSLNSEKGRERRLVMAQRHEFAQVEIRDYLRGRRTHILGGQATLFRSQALDRAAQRTKGNIPWDRDSSVEDSSLSDVLRGLGYSTLVSASARANVGAMVTPQALRQQRIKWTHGHLSDAVKHGQLAHIGSHGHVWRQQVSMAWNLALRLLFVTMLLTSVSLNMFVFVAWWLIPAGLAVTYNTLVALKIPDRQPGELLRSIVFLPDEVALWRTLSVWVTSWCMLLPFVSRQRDLWKRQREAEDSKKAGTLIAWLVMMIAVMVPFGVIMVLSGIFGADSMAGLVELGWQTMWVMTGVSCVVLVCSIARLLSRYREISLH